MAYEYTQSKWDVIVIGTGMGGATLGHFLAKHGKRVLFCEKGRSQLADSDALRGQFAESFFPHPAAPGVEHADVLSRSGRWSDVIEDRSGRRVRHYVPFIGSGAGGSSALYGMALERFYPEDFTPRQNFDTVPEKADLPETWPVTYEDLRPYYREAEALYRVRGEVDPLRAKHLDALPAPPVMTPAALELFDFLQAKGLHPYRLPLACEFVSGCLGCQGFLCAQACKNDSARICLRPAIEQHGARLLDQCQVLSLEANRNSVTGVVCLNQGNQLTLRGDMIVLAAGALETPRLLLASASPSWPKGLANASGRVGRYLMRHYVDLYPVFLKSKEGLGSGAKELAFNDFYMGDLGKGGTVQAFGALPPAPVLVAALEKDLSDGGAPWLVPFFKLAKPFLRAHLARQLSRSMILASIMEDLPYADNRVFPSENGRDPVVVYRLGAYERARIGRLRQQLRSVLKPYRFMVLKQAENNERIAHACGTCRFGTDPQTNVLDPNNKAHHLDNLYVVDSSFFPSSAGINPGLTIAANALRVGHKLLGI